MIFVLINCFWTSLRTWMGRVDNFNNQWDFWIQFLTNFQILYLIWTPLSMQPHGWQGSQKQQNCVVNLNLYDWCTDNTQPDLNQTAKTAKSAKKIIMFFSIFSTLFKFGWISAYQDNCKGSTPLLCNYACNWTLINFNTTPLQIFSCL